MADALPCPRHGTPLKRGEVCHACVLEPAEPGAELTSADVDHELLLLAADYTGRERKLWNETKRLLDDGTAQDINVAAKLSAESAKWARIAREIRGEVSQRKQLREAIAHEQAMTGKRGHH